MNEALKKPYSNQNNIILYYTDYIVVHYKNVVT